MLSAISFAIPDSLNLQGRLTNTAGAVQAGNFNFTFQIYDSYTGGNMLYQTANRTITTDANGIYDIILQNLSGLNFSITRLLGTKL